MFRPKCYTLINKMHDPTKDIRINREKILEWSDKVADITQDSEQFNNIFEIIGKYEDCDIFPVIDTQFYEENVEGWNLFIRKNKLERDYPRHYEKVLFEERRQRREISKMMREDDPSKW